MAENSAAAPPRRRFADLHEQGTFVMPNAWDVGSARLLMTLGAEAVATTSSGFGAALGRMDQQVTIDEVVAHASELATAVDVPVSVDAEHGYADTPVGVARAMDRIAATGAAGVSIEDWLPGTGILEAGAATERVAAAAEVTRRHGLILTARCERHLYGDAGLDETIERLRGYHAAGADVVYAPGLTDTGEIRTLVEAVAAPVNVLLLPDGPDVGTLAGLGVRRVSTGGALAFAAYGALAAATTEVLTAGTSTYTAGSLDPGLRADAFGADD